MTRIAPDLARLRAIREAIAARRAIACAALSRDRRCIARIERREFRLSGTVPPLARRRWVRLRAMRKAIAARLGNRARAVRSPDHRRIA
ncbi:hypothetical protein C6Q12_14090 [Burkholderia multivorans]|nr:hypothetical protein C6Q12_14090 [Burkholderia multivorans]